MIKKNIDSIAFLIKEAKKNKKPMPIIFLGAGASISAGIPLAKKITEDILSKYKDKPEIKSLKDDEKDYYSVMKCLNANERHDLLRAYITDNRVKINVTHIYLAQLLKEEYVDYILTVNFDDLLLKATAMFNFIPPVYDIAILNDFTTTNFQQKSVTYLHGQHHGFWLLNTNEELGKVKISVPNIFNRICNGRTWIIVGYSGGDQIFDHIAELGRFDNDLFWVDNKDNEPSENVQNKLLNEPNKNAYWVSGYDSDSFFLKLHTELGLETPKIFNRPFSFLSDVVNNIKDIESEKYVAEEHKQMFKDIKIRFDTSKRWVIDAVNKYEKGSRENHLEESDISIDKLKQEIIEAGVKGLYHKVEVLYEKAKVNPSKEINELLSTIYSDWGNRFFIKKDYEQSIMKYKIAIKLNNKNDFAFNNWGSSLHEMAKLKGDETLYKESIAKCKIATDLNPRNEIAFNNWGSSLYKMAKLKGDKTLYKESFEKYVNAIKINSKYDKAFNNWGLSLFELAKFEGDKTLFKESIEKYEEATKINPKNDSAFNNWGTSLVELAKLKGDETLYKESFDKYKTATVLNTKNDDAFNNWGNTLSELAKLKGDETLYKESFVKYNEATKLNPKYGNSFNNWGTSLYELAKLKGDETLYKESFVKYDEATKLNPKNDSAFNNWGASLFEFAKLKGDETLYKESFEKYDKATKINPKDGFAFNNWGVSLSGLAKLKEDETLYKESLKKYNEATMINLKDGSAFNNWCTALLFFARLLPEEKKFKILSEAKEKGEKSRNLGGSVYNLSCVHALLKEKQQALEYLEESLKRGDIKINHVVKDEDWQDFYEDEDFKKIVEKYRKK